MTQAGDRGAVGRGARLGARAGAGLRPPHRRDPSAPFESPEARAGAASGRRRDPASHPHRGAVPGARPDAPGRRRAGARGAGLGARLAGRAAPARLRAAADTGGAWARGARPRRAALRQGGGACGRSTCPLDDGIRLEQDLYVLLQTTADRREGVRSFLERRPPRYEGR